MKQYFMKVCFRCIGAPTDSALYADLELRVAAEGVPGGLNLADCASEPH